MATALTLLLIGGLLQSAQCGEFKVFMPQTMNVLSGSCVTIPCSFDVEDKYRSHFDETCKAMWRNEQDVVVFDSSNPQSPIKGNLRGDLTKKDCTTTLNNMKPEDSKKYHLRVECNNPMKYNFKEQKVEISVKDHPPTLTPSTLKVNDGNSVTLTCSAPVPCPSHPPTLTWSPGLGVIQETLWENQDKTKVKISLLTFTASHLHHGQEISCTAVYNKQDGSSTSTVSTLTADVSCAQCGEFNAFMPQTINVLSGSCVTIPCSFDVQDKYRSHFDETCKAKWKNEQDVVFDSSNPQSPMKVNLTGDLTKTDCTTTLNNMKPEDSNKYYLRVECDNDMKYDFIQQKLEISVKDHPPKPTLTLSILEVNKGDQVKLTCSAPVPCLSHPPTLTWSPDLGDIQETLQENQDKTKVKTSVLTFTASHLRDRQEISCNAVYNKQDGSTESSVSTLTVDVSCAQCGEFNAFMPQTINVLSGSCVTIPCSFDVEDRYRSNLDETCKAMWKNEPDDVVFDSSNPQSPIKGNLTGDLTKKDCTTTLNNMKPEDSKKYFLRVECNNPIKHNFIQQKMEISVKDDPLTLTLTPSTLEVNDGNSVTLTCSAPVPCLSHPPTLTWTPDLGDIQETLQENQDKTKVKTSVLTFTASHLHHGQEISCTAVYNKQDGSTESSVSTLTADVSFAPQILSSSDCTQTADQLNCSCETVGNPSPTLQWYLDGLPVIHSDKFAISSESLHDTGLRIMITVNQPQWRDLSTLLCRSSNSLGSVTQRFHVYSLEPQTSAESHDLVMLTVLIAVVVALLLLVCALLLVIRAQKIQHNRLKSTVAMSQLTSGEGNEEPNKTEESIYANTNY